MSDAKHHRTLPWLLVVVQTLSAAAIVLTARISLDHAGAFIASTVGLLVGSWAVLAIGIPKLSVLPDVKVGTELVTHGPYRLVRHPMYSALLLFTGGLAFSPFAFWKCLIWFLLGGVLLIKLLLEERQLAERFPAYEAYARRTKRLIPFVF